MEAVLTSLSATNKALELLSTKHQTHAGKLHQLRTALDSMSTDISSISTPQSDPVILTEERPFAATLDRLQAYEAAIEQRIREGDQAIEADADRLRAAQAKLQTEAEARWKELANEYLAALKSFK